MSSAIIQLLRARHSRDRFFPEALLGPGGSRRVDAWVLCSTWSPLTTIAYEVKVSRGDFLRDDKWPAYLPACHQLYFVCPAKLIQPEEMPAGVGLLWVTETGGRLYCKRKAARREPEDAALVQVMAHVLMWHDAATGRHINTPDRGRRIEQWKLWLAQQAEGKAVGRLVRGRIGDTMVKLHERNERLRATIKRWAGFAQRLRRLGINPGASTWEFDRKIDQLVGNVPPHLEQQLREGGRQLERLAEAVKLLSHPGVR